MAAVAERIRRPMPAGLSVLAGSLPVVSFGDPGRATVATLALNPSWVEFQSRSGVWLRGGQRRLASLVSLGVDDPRELDDGQVAQVVAESNAYFGGPNWYRPWFHWLQSLLDGVRAGSYLDGSACHLDLVQWATKPAQGGLPAGVWDRLVEQDRDFLHWQLGNSNVEVVFLNGGSVVRWVKQAGLVAGFDEDVLAYLASQGSAKIRVFRGVAEGVLFLGWTRPLAGALAADGRRRLSRWLTGAVRERGCEAAPRDEEQPAWGVGAVPAAGDLVNGFVPAVTRVEGAPELERVLSRWVEASDRATVGDAGRFGGSPVITVQIGADEVVLNRDTKRAAVQTFLVAAARAGGAAFLPWHVAANSRGTLNRVGYRGDDAPTPGWYAYLRRPASEPRGLG